MNIMEINLGWRWPSTAQQDNPRLPRQGLCRAQRWAQPHPELLAGLRSCTYILIDVKEGGYHGVLDLIEIRELPEHPEHAPHALAAHVVAWDIFQ